MADATKVIVDGVTYIGNSISSLVDTVIDAGKWAGEQVGAAWNSVTSYFKQVTCEKTEGQKSEEGDRTINPDGLTPEEQSAINDVLQGTKKGDETKGKTEQRVKSGSSEGSPTLQIPEGASRQIEIRYK